MTHVAVAVNVCGTRTPTAYSPTLLRTARTLLGHSPLLEIAARAYRYGSVAMRHKETKRISADGSWFRLFGQLSPFGRWIACRNWVAKRTGNYCAFVTLHLQNNSILLRRSNQLLGMAYIKLPFLTLF